MDSFLAREIVENLSRGIDPLSGRILPQSDICSNEEIQDALREVLDHCTIESNEQYLFRLKAEKSAAKQKRRELNAQKYPRGGEPWRADEERQLLQMHHKGFNIPSPNRGRYGFDGQKGAHTASSPLEIRKYSLRAFPCPDTFLLRQNCFAPAVDEFSSDFWLLSRRRADAR